MASTSHHSSRCLLSVTFNYFKRALGKAHYRRAVNGCLSTIRALLGIVKIKLLNFASTLGTSMSLGREELSFLLCRVLLTKQQAFLSVCSINRKPLAVIYNEHFKSHRTRFEQLHVNCYTLQWAIFDACECVTERLKNILSKGQQDHHPALLKQSVRNVTSLQPIPEQNCV